MLLGLFCAFNAEVGCGVGLSDRIRDRGGDILARGGEGGGRLDEGGRGLEPVDSEWPRPAKGWLLFR